VPCIFLLHICTLLLFSRQAQQGGKTKATYRYEAKKQAGVARSSKALLKMQKKNPQRCGKQKMNQPGYYNRLNHIPAKNHAGAS
jgi:hypothetical protein